MYNLRKHIDHGENSGDDESLVLPTTRWMREDPVQWRRLEALLLDKDLANHQWSQL